MAPSTKCGKCNKIVPLKTEEKFTCKKCLKVYHKLCCAKNDNNICELCTLDSPHKQGSATPSSSLLLDLDPKAVSVEALLVELNKKMQVVMDIREDTSFYAAKYDEMVTKQNELLQIIKKQQNQFEDLSNRFKNLEKVNQSLQQRVEALEQAEKSSNIEIVGLKMADKENTLSMVQTVAKRLDVKLEDVERAWRLGRPVPGRRPPPLIVKLRSVAARDLWMGKRGLLRSNKDIFSDENDDSPIFFNEDLTKHNRDLLWNVKQKLKATFKYIWVKNGRILCKKIENAKTIQVTSMADLDKIVAG